MGNCYTPKSSISPPKETTRRIHPWSFTSQTTQSHLPSKGTLDTYPVPGKKKWKLIDLKSAGLVRGYVIVPSKGICYNPNFIPSSRRSVQAHELVESIGAIHRRQRGGGGRLAVAGRETNINIETTLGRKGIICVVEEPKDVFCS